MEPTPFESFLRFLFVFMLFISVSFGVTFFASRYLTVQDAAQHAAAMEALMLQYKK